MSDSVGASNRLGILSRLSKLNRLVSHTWHRRGLLGSLSLELVIVRTERPPPCTTPPANKAAHAFDGVYRQQWASQQHEIAVYEEEIRRARPH